MSTQNKQLLQVGLLIMILLLGAGIYVRFFFLQTELDRLAKEQQSASAKLQALEEESQSLLGLKSRELEIREIMHKVNKQAERLPSEDQIPELIRIIRSMLLQTGVTVNSAKELKRVSRSKYSEIPYALTCRSPYHNFGQFLNMVEVNPQRLMRVKEFEVTVDPKKPQLHEVKFTLATYMTRRKMRIEQADLVKREARDEPPPSPTKRGKDVEAVLK